ncbi:ATP-binding protein [Actinomadura sp. NEAU-AAG7]|uniref:ATP-binding protein n=1 Tax=Actinomadura sp. NEAU-AAG7 TaxID=2839640 RepID=UPI001BE4D5DD|nr:ATP-binding protein [Actinomadura sp. NEAU-AAG7]MBT2208705.1 ATP-binding protein [Actinomadura sp. NEAU-AAG7]
MMPERFVAAFAGDDVRTVAEARRWARRTLTASGLAEDTVCDALTCVSELATNAARHTRSGDQGGTYQVVLQVHSDHAHVEVVDQGAAHAPDVRLGGGESGRGLWICAQLGALSLVCTGGGRRIWVDLPRPVGAAVSSPSAHITDGSAD